MPDLGGVREERRKDRLRWDRGVFPLLRDVCLPFFPSEVFFKQVSSVRLTAGVMVFGWTSSEPPHTIFMLLGITSAVQRPGC